MKDKNPDQLARIERAIADKYGEESIVNPRSTWDDIKEKDYLTQMKEFYKKVQRNEASEEKIDINGIKVSKKLLNRESLISCSVCGSFSKKSMDDVCLTKFTCCYGCYIKYVEDREERWEEGWRPDEANQKKS